MAHDCVPVFDGLCKLLSAFEHAYTEAKSRQMPGIFPMSPKQRCASYAIRRHSGKQAHSMMPYSSTKCRIPTNCRTPSYLSLPALRPLSGLAT